MPARALVLGGGGLLGTAWEIGLLIGLREAGTDLTSADLVVGTSAGAVTGTKVGSGAPLDALFAGQHDPDDRGFGTYLQQVELATVRTVYMRWASAERMTPELRVELGAMALAARTPAEAAWIDLVRREVGVEEWPERPLLITAVDAADGSLRVFDRATGFPVWQAVAASGAVPSIAPPVSIAGRRYVDGGVSSGTNAQLAEGYARVVVIAPVGSGSQDLGPLARRQLEAEVAALRAGGSRVAVVMADEATNALFSPSRMDPTRRAAAADAGRRQAALVAADLGAVWGATGPAEVGGPPASGAAG